MHYIGMDVHKKVTMICILDDNSKVVRETSVKGSLRELLLCMKLLRRDTYHLMRGGKLRRGMKMESKIETVFDKGGAV
ncbi:MAG: hypothetical protein HZA50_01630 [Planctomycetes bacterium]|nr:hypothetical protein [Planctomycetota bacterium]